MGKDKLEETINWSSYPEGTTEIPNPNFHFGSYTFTYPNGDVYIGQFCAHRMGIAWREGKGIYMTKDGHIYDGIWENDKLINSEDTKIRYPDGTVYRGPVIDNKYNGSAIFYLPNGLPIDCTFEENHPVGPVVLTDPQKRLWKGTVDEDHAILLPENHFYLNLPYERGIGKRVSIKHSEEEIKNAKSIPSNATCLKELQETTIFKKSKKTFNSINSVNVTPQSVEEETVSAVVNCKKNVKRKSSLLKARSSNNVALLKTFLSKEFRSACSPSYLLEPTADMERKYINK